MSSQHGINAILPKIEAIENQLKAACQDLLVDVFVPVKDKEGNGTIRFSLKSGLEWYGAGEAEERLVRITDARVLLLCLKHIGELTEKAAMLCNLSQDAKVGLAKAQKILGEEKRA